MSATMHQRTPVAKRSPETPDKFIIGGLTYERKWHVIDAAGQVIGRLADKIAKILMGKHRATYTPHVDTGDFVVVVNCEKVDVKGRRMLQKTYDHYTYYPGGGREELMKDVFARKPEFVFSEAVRRMLPKTKLGRAMLAKLKVYKGPNHPHQAQQPTALKITTSK
jgi:large subunit ribosomal protein L13